jgi:exodeoxyribonuclease V gamma subunit
LGQASLDRELVQLAGFADELARATQAPCLPPHHAVLDFEFESAGQSELWRISSEMNALRSGGLVRHRYDDTRAVDYLEGWLGHLFMCASADDAATMETLWISRDGSFRLHPCADARKILHELLGLYRQGLSEPIHFFPKSAWSYIAAEQSLSKARASWLSTRDRPWGEDKDAYYRLALRGVANPLDAGFERCAQLVFGSMMSCLEDARL